MQPKTKAKKQKLKKKILLCLCSLIVMTLLTKSFLLAAGLLLMIFAHESGHIWAAKRRGIKTNGMYFLPGLGAVALVEEMYEREAECYVAIMGPVAGALYSFLFFAMFFLTEVEIFLKIAGICSMINLFNFIPINPLDGGRIVKSILFSIHRNIGLLIMGVMTVGSLWLAWNFSYIFWLITLYCVVDLHIEKKGDKDITRELEEIDDFKKEGIKVIVKDYYKHKPKMNFIEIVAYSILCLQVMWFLLKMAVISHAELGGWT